MAPSPPRRLSKGWADYQPQSAKTKEHGEESSAAADYTSIVVTAKIEPQEKALVDGTSPPTSAPTSQHYTTAGTTAGAWKDPKFALENKGKISVRPELRPNKPGCLQSIGDACFNCGDAIMSRLPERVQNFFHDAAPPAIANIDGGVEMVFFMLFMLQMGLAASFFYYFITNMQSCLKASYLSLDGSGYKCRNVPIQIADKYYMDDNGYWDTNKNWAFANTMLATDFTGYKHTEEEYHGPANRDFKTTREKGISADIFRTYYNWNQEMSNKGQAQNLVKLVVANSNVKKSGGSSLNVQTVANPKNIMDTTYQYCYFASLNSAKYQGDLLSYSSSGDFFTLTTTNAKWSKAFPKWNIKTNDDDGSGQGSKNDFNLKINKYSLWVAAAINMGILDMSELTSLTESTLVDDDGSGDDDGDDDDNFDDDDDDDGDDDDDDFLSTGFDDDDDDDDDDSSSRRLSRGSTKLQPGSKAKDKLDEKQPAFKERTVQETKDKFEEDEKNFGHIHRKLSHGATKTQGENFLYDGPHEQTKLYVLRKYFELMDPIRCTYYNVSRPEDSPHKLPYAKGGREKTQASFCWIDLVPNIDDDKAYGGYLFPIIQTYKSGCAKCDKDGRSNKPKTAGGSCSSTTDLEYIMYFSKQTPTMPYYLRYNNTGFYHYGPYNSTTSFTTDDDDFQWGGSSGFNAMVYMNLYLGVDYLNEFFYTMPDAQCSTPIAIASAFKKNDLACGTKYARRRLSMKKKDGSLTKSSTALRKKYCFVTPESPQEKYYECKTDPPTCVTNSLAAGQAVMAVVNTVAMFIILFISQKFLRIPISNAQLIKAATEAKGAVE